jgi:tRNA modification GTPase
LPEELLALDLREALDVLGHITGETTPDDILDLVFGQFCIGK